MRRALPPFLLLLLLGALGGFAWLTQNPDNPWLEEAQTWPLVGELARRFRATYVGPETPPQTARAEPDGSGDEPEPGKSERRIPAARPPAGARAAASETAAPETAVPETAAPVPGSLDEPIRLSPDVDPTADRSASRSGSELTETLTRIPRGSEPAPRIPTRPRFSVPYMVVSWDWFLPGQRILTAADAAAPLKEQLTSMAWLPILEHQGPWVQVVHRGRRGWIDASWEPPFNRRKARRGLLRYRAEPVQSHDWIDLRRARKILGNDDSLELGPYTLWTNVEDEELLDFLDRAATAAEEAYFARYGRLPTGKPLWSVILFSQEAEYRTYSEDHDLPSGRHTGHAGRGSLAFFAEGHSRRELAGTLVHEISHLLNDRSLALRLPPWLEEGLATDLGSLWVEDSEVVEPVEAGSRRSLELQSFDARLLSLEAYLGDGRLPPIAAILNLDREGFYQPGMDHLTYPYSAALIRYLLDGDDGRHADAFRAFLRDIAIGRAPDPRKLIEELGMELPALDQSFRRWLEEEIPASRQRLVEQASKLR